MSLHAQLSPEAAARLHAQQRNATITSLVISILVICLIGIILLWILLPPIDNTTPDIVSYQAGEEEAKKEEKRVVKRVVERKPAAPSTSMARVIASNTTSSMAIPVPDIDVLNPSLDFGNTESFGDDWGSGEDFGGGFGGIPGSMRKRCTAAGRLERLDNNGGNVKCEEAVIKALNWLKKNQEENGSWSHVPTKGAARSADEYRLAMTGFALLAFLGHSESPNSPDFGDTVNAAIIYLTDIGMKNDGKLTTTLGHHWVYEHGIATYALAEAYTFCLGLDINIPNLDKVTKKAGDLVINGQSSSGSWVYGYAKGGGDNSVGYWQIQAVKASKLTGLWRGKSTFKEVFKKAEEWFSKVQGKNGAFGYREKPTQHPGLTGGGVLCLQMMGLGDSKAAKAGIEYVASSIKNKPFNLHHLYYHYYNAQAMINHGGTEWKNYNKFFRNDLLKLQNKDGSWPANGGHGSVNPVMATCLSTFMLEVYYRFLPTSEQ